MNFDFENKNLDTWVNMSEDEQAILLNAYILGARIQYHTWDKWCDDENFAPFNHNGLIYRIHPEDLTDDFVTKLEDEMGKPPLAPPTNQPSDQERQIMVYWVVDSDGNEFDTTDRRYEFDKNVVAKTSITLQVGEGI